MPTKLIDFARDDASQDLLGYAGIDRPYEEIITEVSLDILRQSVPNCEIESIRFVSHEGNHPDFRVGGMPMEGDSSKIIFQDMTMPFDIEFTVRSDKVRHRIKATFTFECLKIDEEPNVEYRLEILSQEEIG